MFYNWKIAFTNSHFRNKFIISALILSFIIVGFASLLAYIETTQGHLFYDPVLNFIKPRDVSYFIFIVTYTTVLVGLIYAIISPYRFLHFMQMFGTLTLLRIMILFFIPMGSPESSIPLHDESLFHNFYAGSVYLKDLFFSGYAATLFLFYLFTTSKWLKYLFLAAFIAVSVGVVVQHIHYSYDVIAAPIFAYIAYRIITKFSKHYYTQTPEKEVV